MISAPLATLVRASPPTKQVLIQAVPDQAERGEAEPVAARHLAGV